LLASCVKHNNSHLEMKSGTSSVRQVFKSSVKDDEAMMLTFVKILSTKTSSMGFNSGRVNSMEENEIISPL